MPAKKRKKLMTVSDMARLGGLALAKLRKAGKVEPSGKAAMTKPKACVRCGEVQPTTRAANAHCRKTGQPGRPKKIDASA